MSKHLTESVDLIPAAIALYRQVCLTYGIHIGPIDKIEHHGCDGDSSLFLRDGTRVEVHPGLGLVYINSTRYIMPKDMVADL